MKKIAVLISILLFLVSVVSAAPNKWADKQYDFTAVKKVLVMHPTIAPGVKDEFALQKTEDILNAQKEKLKVQLVSYDALLQQMGPDLEIDLAELNKKDPEKCRAIVKENAHKYVDLVLYSEVNEMGWTKKYVPPSTYTYTKNETTTVNTSDGRSATVTKPTQKTSTIPGGDRDFASASFGAKLFDAKTDKVLWGYSDAKREQKGLFNNADPERYMKNIIEKAFEDMPLIKTPEK